MSGAVGSQGVVVYPPGLPMAENILRGAGRPTAPALLNLLLTHQLDLNFAPERMRNANEGGDSEVPRFVLHRRDLRRAHIGHGSQPCLTESFFLAELGNLNPQLEILEFPLHKIPEPLIFHLLFVETIPTSSHFLPPFQTLAVKPHPRFGYSNVFLCQLGRSLDDAVQKNEDSLGISEVQDSQLISSLLCP